MSAIAALPSSSPLDVLRERAAQAALPCQWWSVRALHELSETHAIRSGVRNPPTISDDLGAMITVLVGGVLGYAATPDLSISGLRAAFQQALTHAHAAQSWPLFRVAPEDLPNPRTSWSAPSLWAPTATSRREWADRLHQWDAAMNGPKVVDRGASLLTIDVRQVLITSSGGEAEVRYRVMYPVLEVFASNGVRTQIRSHRDYARQAGPELFDELDLDRQAEQLREEAVQLLDAPNCPSGPTTLLLAPDQITLQIHESIGHPLEMDRILGDERNFAGTSFVTPEMFGSFQYGSELLNITFDPTVPGELVSLPIDDHGTPTETVDLIRNGVLLRPLGGQLSQQRSGLEGAATTRACSWNRPPIDRMSNLNLESGTSTEAELIKGTERGILMRTVLSWSIDDSRNKFQFGCQLGERIEDGEIVGLVRNPCYRGVSSTFWRSLNGVAKTRGIHGTPFCGKGEPTQVVRVGHASPMCRFAGVDVFGAEA